VRASHPLSTDVETQGCIMFALRGGCLQVSRAGALAGGPLGAAAPPRVEFSPSHLSYALRASGHVLRPAALLAPRGPTPKSRFPCASGP
jgi:hypothetical protein